MQKIDNEILSVVEQLNSITDEIIDGLSASDIQLDYVGELYSSREVHISSIKEYVADESSKILLESNKDNWNNMMNSLREKDKKALVLLKSRVKSMEEEIKIKEKQKNVLLYKESLK